MNEINEELPILQHPTSNVSGYSSIQSSAHVLPVTSEKVALPDSSDIDDEDEDKTKQKNENNLSAIQQLALKSIVASSIINADRLEPLPIHKYNIDQTDTDLGIH